MKVRIFFAVALFVCATCVGTANATTLFVQWHETTNYSATLADVGTQDFGLGWAEGWLNGNASTGTYIGQVFCVDLLNYSGSSPWQVNVYNDATSFSSNDGDSNETLEEDEFRTGANGLGRAAYLVNKYAASAWQNKQASVALQFAIYKQVYGDRLTSFSGMSGTEQSLYDSYMADINGATDPIDNRYTWYDNDDITIDRYQDFMRPIPEPTSLGILGLGLLGLGLLRRRRV